VARHFVPVALDTYFRGARDELEFCKAIGAGGNHVVAATAGGRILAAEAGLRLRRRELEPALEEFRALPEAERRPALPSAEGVPPPERPVPVPPKNGLILRGYCAYLRADAEGRPARLTRYYYEENPDRWAAETQSDTIWLTEEEWKGLVPADPAPGAKVEVPEGLRRRFFCTLGIDYMEGSVNSLPEREGSLTLTRLETGDLRIDGFARLGEPFDEEARRRKNSRGCEIRVVGLARAGADGFRRFDLAGVGRAWGCKMDYVSREVRGGEHPWMYGIALERVAGETPMERIPPYNMLHYDSARAYAKRR
jgi:hypothetical protein